jgi:hypothetical protein
MQVLAWLSSSVASCRSPQANNAPLRRKGKRHQGRLLRGYVVAKQGFDRDDA